MRTDSTRIAQEAVQAARNYIKNTDGEAYLPARAVNYRSKKGAQDAHEAIRPTVPLRTPEELKSYLNNEQYRLYDLIWKRLIASQMNPAILDATTIDIKAGTYLFRATGSVIKFNGFRRIYMEGKDDPAANENEVSEENINLPTVKAGDTLDLRKLEPKQHFTQPPPRYNEATLVKMLEAKGIGRPSTYASILSTIQDRGYVTKERRQLAPTDVGRLVNTLLIKGFENIVDVRFTAEMEKQLDTIAEGKVKWPHTLDEFYPSFQAALQAAPDKMYEARKAMEEESDEKCDKCGSNMIVKWGRYGRFLGCANYPECKTIKSLNADDTPPPEPELTDTECDKCGKPMVIRTSRAGSKFLSCSGYPKCKNAKPIPIGIDCPEADCDGYLGERRSRRGKVFYGCSNYPKCEFSTWDKPLPELCPACNAPFLVEKTKKTRGSEIVTTLTACPSCEYTK